MLLDVPQDEHDRRLVVCMNVVRKWRDFMGARRPAPANEEAQVKLAENDAVRRIRAHSAMSAGVSPLGERQAASRNGGQDSPVVRIAAGSDESYDSPAASRGSQSNADSNAVLVDAANLDAALELGEINAGGGQEAPG